MRNKENEYPINGMRQDVVDKWLEGIHPTEFLMFSVYGVEGIKQWLREREKQHV